MRVTISLACSICGTRNYRTTRSMVSHPAPLALRKFCKTCNQHTMHRETK